MPLCWFCHALAHLSFQQSLIRVFERHSVGSKDQNHLQAKSEDSDQPCRYHGLITRLQEIRWLFFPILNLLTMKALWRLQHFFLQTMEIWVPLLVWAMAHKFALFTKGSKLPINKGFKNMFELLQSIAQPSICWSASLLGTCNLVGKIAIAWPDWAYK